MADEGGWALAVVVEVMLWCWQRGAQSRGQGLGAVATPCPSLGSLTPRPLPLGQHPPTPPPTYAPNHPVPVAPPTHPQLTSLDLSLTRAHTPPPLPSLRRLAMIHCELDLLGGEEQERRWLEQG